MFTQFQSTIFTSSKFNSGIRSIVKASMVTSMLALPTLGLDMISSPAHALVTSCSGAQLTGKVATYISVNTETGTCAYGSPPLDFEEGFTLRLNDYRLELSQNHQGPGPTKTFSSGDAIDVTSTNITATSTSTCVPQTPDSNSIGIYELELYHCNNENFSWTATVVKDGITYELVLDMTNVSFSDATYTIASQSFSGGAFGASTSPELDVRNEADTADISDGDLQAQISAVNGTDFGSVVIGNAVANTFIVKNTGTADLTFQNPGAAVDDLTNFSAVDSSFGGMSVTAGTSRTFTVTFHPDVAGPLSSTVTLRSNDADEDPYTFVVSGTGLDVPEIEVSSFASSSLTDEVGESHNSGVAGSVTTATYTIRNTGSQVLNLTNTSASISNTTNVGTPIVSDYSSTSLAADGGSATFSVTYTPEIAGNFGFDLDIISNDSDEATFDIPVTGTASGMAVINIQGNGQDITYGATSPSTSDHTDFGDVEVGVKTQRTFTIQNTGTDSLAITSIETDNGDFTTSGVPSSVAAKSSETFNVDLTAAAPGARTAIITVKHNALEKGNYSFDVEANALAPEISISSTSNNTINDGSSDLLGAVGIGATSSVTYTITNNGTSALELTNSAPTLSNPVNVGTPIVNNYSGTTVAANGGTVTFTIEYTTGTDGAFSFDLQILSNDADEGTFDIAASGTAVDLDAPYLISVVRQSPTTEKTNADSLTWRLTFSEEVAGFDAADVEIEGTTATVTSLLAVSGIASEYDLTISGGDLASLNGEVETSFKETGVTIQDLAGNHVLLAAPIGVDENTFIMVNETVAPRITSVERFNPLTETTDSDYLVWRVIFDEDVTGVDAADFQLSGTTAPVYKVIEVSPSTYEVQAFGGDLENLVGTVTLSAIANSGNIQDISGNSFANVTPTTKNENTYNVFNDVVGPVLTSITRQSPTDETTGADSLTWRFTFDEETLGFDAADVMISGTTATVNDVSSISSSVYDVTITGGDLAKLNAVVQIALDSSLTIKDNLGNNATVSVPSINQNSYTLVNDVVAPRILSIERHNPTTQTTQETTLTWRITFDEEVFNVQTSDFYISGFDKTSINLNAVSATIYDVTVSEGDGELGTVAGTIQLNISEKGERIADASGNLFTDTTPTGTNNNSYNIELPISSTTAQVSSDDGTDIPDGGSDKKPDEPAGQPITNSYTFTNKSSSPITLNGAPKIAGSNNAGNPTVSNFSAPFNVAFNNNDLTFGARSFALAGEITTDIFKAIGNSIITPAYASSITLQPGESTSFEVTYTPENPGEYSVEVDVESSEGTFDIAVSGSAVDTQAPSVSINGAPSAHDNSSAFNVTFEFSEDVTGFVLADITVGNGVASNFITVDGNTYTANITPSSAANTTIDVASSVAVDGSGNPNTAASQVLVSGGVAVKETLTAIADFMVNRANNILSNQPDMIGFINGTNNQGGGPLGHLQLNSDLDSETTMSFFTSRSKILAARDGGFGKGDRPTLQNETPLFATADRFSDDVDTSSNLVVKRDEEHGPEPQGFNINDRTGKWDIWTKINGSKSSQTNLKSEFWSANFGTHYFISNDVLVGMLTQFDWAEEINHSTGSIVSGNGFMVGPYVAGKVKDQNLYYEARALWGKSSNDVTPIGTYTDNFETERWLASLKVQGSYDLNDEVTIKPEVSISYFKEKQEAYTDSNSDFIPEQTISLGEFKFGPTVTRQFDVGNGYTMRTSAGLSGIANFSVKSAYASSSNTFANEKLRARLDAEVEVENEYGIRFTAAGYYDGIGASDFQSYGGTLGLIIPLQ
ncbi:MAG: choice-of-anchor D domain-containing protein [Lentilitoribacter sp.]